MARSADASLVSTRSIASFIDISSPPFEAWSDEAPAADRFCERAVDALLCKSGEVSARRAGEGLRGVVWMVCGRGRGAHRGLGHGQSAAERRCAQVVVVF